MAFKAHYLKIKLKYVKCLAWCQIHNKCSLDDSSCFMIVIL